MSIFLDTNIVVYLIERTPNFGPLAAKHIQTMISQSQRLVVSDLVRMEYRVRPLRLNDAITLSAFDGYFDSEDVDVTAVTAAVCDRAAAIRAQYKFSPMDSLHLAAAVEHGCQQFLTHDVRLRSFSEISVGVLSQC